MEIYVKPVQGPGSKKNINNSYCYVFFTDHSSTYEYTGSPICPQIEVLYNYNGTTLVEGTDYTVSYDNNTEIGTATVTITGMGIYENSRQEEFEITPRYVYFPDVPASFTYDGQEHTAVPASEDYTISGDNTATDAGTYTATLSLVDPEHTVWVRDYEEVTGDQSVTWTIVPKTIYINRNVHLENTAGSQYSITLSDFFQAEGTSMGFTFGEVTVSGANTIQPDDPAYVTAALEDGVLTLSATGVDNNPYEDYDMCSVQVQAVSTDGNIVYQFHLSVDSRGSDEPEKVTPDIRIRPSRSSLTGGGSVTLTVSGIPQGGSVNVSYNGSGTVAENADGSFSVTLPNRDATYTFTAFYGGNESYQSAYATCTVKVYYKDTDTDAGSGSSDYNSGSSDDNDDDPTTDTVRNPDGSTTTTVTSPNGTITTTTTDKEGNKTQVEEKPNGTVTTTVDSSNGSSSVSTTSPSGSVAAAVVLSEAAVVNAGISGKAAALPMPSVTAASSSASAPVITVSLPLGAPAMVEIPVENATLSTVAVLVKADGSEQVIKASLPTENGLAVTLNDGDTVKVVENDKSFGDVPSSHWAADAISFASSREIFSGTGGDSFSPDLPMSRAMIVTVLASYDGADMASGSGAWYEAGRQWAMERGISDGASMEASLTREQLITMLWRYAGSPAASGSLSDYTDGDTVSGYAVQAMTWANSAQ